MDSKEINLAGEEGEKQNKPIQEEMNKKIKLLIITFAIFLIVFILVFIILASVNTDDTVNENDSEEKGNGKNPEGEVLNIFNCTYETSINDEEIRILGDEFKNDIQMDIIIDGKKQKFAKIFLFELVGEHSVQFKLYTKSFSMDYMFKDASSLKSIKMLSKENYEITSMVGTFQNCENLQSLENNGFVTKNVKSMRGLFFNTGIVDFNFTKMNINTESVEDMSYMFSSMKAQKLNIYNLNTKKVSNMSHMFKNSFLLTSLNLSGFDIKNVVDTSYMFSSCFLLEKLDLENFKENKITNMSHMFHDCISLTELKLSKLKTNNVADLSGLFKSCLAIKSIDLNNFDTSNVVNMNEMFSDCTNLETLNIESFNTEKCKSFDNIFENCEGLKLYLDEGKTSNLKKYIPEYVIVNEDEDEDEDEE